MTTRKNKCPKCGAKVRWNVAGLTVYDCETEQGCMVGVEQSNICKLIITRRKLKREKARLDALEALDGNIEQWTNAKRNRWHAEYKVDTYRAPTLRQLADKLIGGGK